MRAVSGAGCNCRSQLNGKAVRPKGPSRCCHRNGKQVRTHQKATGKTCEGDASRLVSPDTGLAQNSGSATGWWRRFPDQPSLPLRAFFSMHSGMRGRLPERGNFMKFAFKTLAALVPLAFLQPVAAVEQLASLEAMVVTATRQVTQVRPT